VLRFLSDEWLAALERAAEAATDAVDPDLDMVIQQVVTDDDGTEIAYHLVLRGGRVRAHRGRASAPTVTFITDRDTAARINQGIQSAQAAFMTGGLRIGGDIRALASQQASLAGLQDLFGALRAETSY
jgi:hypothetical protein